MKKSLALFLFVLLCIPSLAKVQWEVPDDILAAGLLEFPRGRSLSFPKATIQENQVSVTFFEALSDVTLTITSASGVVMQTRTVSFTAFQTEILNVSNCPKGTYTLSITTPRGTDLHGSFNIK